MNFDPNKIRPAKDGWALVLADDRKVVRESGIILAVETGAEKVTEFAGRVVSLGEGVYVSSLRENGLTEGCRVVYRGFLKYANPLPTEETWPSGAKKEFFFIDCKDILGIVEEGVEVGVYSGRPTVPHVQPKGPSDV